ncbi:MAG: MvaI/BcnI family restriction endonuclease [Desulfitobacterium sp.]
MFNDINSLSSFMLDKGVTRIIFKCLSENDNTKQQIYLGSSFEAINQIPFGEVHPDNVQGKYPNYKAALKFYWLDEQGNIEIAPKAQLILYPKYPEVRLSSFLQYCSIAPRELLQPISTGERRFFNAKDGRVLVFGICPDGRILAYLSAAETPLANKLISLEDTTNLFTSLETESSCATKETLLIKIREIMDRGWIAGCRMNNQGIIVDYNAPNAGGYTLEANMGIIPNGRSEPDWKGWEVKAYTSNRITLMTPEPDSGYYGEYRVEQFVRKYGRTRPAGDFYFTGVHKCGDVQDRTKLKMILDGYDEQKKRIVNVTGGLTLLDENNEPAAIWTYAKLIEHWGRKHAHAVYIPYNKRNLNGVNEYQYSDPILLGEGSDFIYFLEAFRQGLIVYDPASKVFINDNGRVQTKARNQFRIKVTDLGGLYNQFSQHIVLAD